MQSSPSVDTSRGWIGQTPPAGATQRVGKAETRSPETPRAVSEKEEAFPDVLKQVVNPTKGGMAQTAKAQTNGAVSSDFKKTQGLSDPDSKSESSSEMAGMLPAWLTSLLDGLAVPVSALQVPVCAGFSATADAQAGTSAVVGAGQGRAPLDALLQRLQSALKDQETVDPDGQGISEDELAVLQKSLTENVPAGAALVTQFEGTDEGAGEEMSLPTLVTIRHTTGAARAAGDDGDSQTGTAEEALTLDSDPDARVLLRKLVSARDGDGALQDGNGAGPQNPVAGQTVDLRHAALPTDRFSLDATASLRHVDLTNAVRQAQVAIADMTERMQGEVSLNTESLRAVLRLDPPALGRLNIRLEIDDTQRVTAYLHADQAQTGDFLRQNEGDLRQGFTRQGFDSDKVKFVYEEGETGNFDQWLTEKTRSA